MGSASFFVPEIRDFPVVDARDVAEALLLTDRGKIYERGCYGEEKDPLRGLALAPTMMRSVVPTMALSM
ncbi:hypothetical protein H0E87_003698 [Populus deltoides]|uniref:Uncharacterized protein n=1 Tax=Populus deltoides TaxID=3696 RepID=A0A8T2ZBG0_POPDE|nr:hypothetical protein H0E87_003698 [Populus deltoides]